jgi:hypothetical protein
VLLGVAASQGRLHRPVLRPSGASA